jgi:hypothetical protein
MNFNIGKGCEKDIIGKRLWNVSSERLPPRERIETGQVSADWHNTSLGADGLPPRERIETNPA